jgi:hypothetical protein
MLKRKRSSGSETSVRERIPRTTAIEALLLYRIPHGGAKPTAIACAEFDLIYTARYTQSCNQRE